MVELLIALLIWTLFHTLMAAVDTKAWFQRSFGERAYRGLYRLLYNVVAGWTLLPILYLLITRAPGGTVWSVPMPFRLVNYTLQLIGALGALVALWQTDVWRFLGLRQLVRYVRGEADPELPSPFIATGAYRLVRHPIYFFGLLALWANPVMSWPALIVSLWAVVYFLAGSFHEEQRLIDEFGDAYRHYRAQVPRILPLPRRSNQSSIVGK